MKKEYTGWIVAAILILFWVLSNKNGRYAIGQDGNSAGSYVIDTRNGDLWYIGMQQIYFGRPNKPAPEFMQKHITPEEPQPSEIKLEPNYDPVNGKTKRTLDDMLNADDAGTIKPDVPETKTLDSSLDEVQSGEYPK